jgi:two-component system, chemotaxis family, sensor kinase CheA
MPNQNSDNTEDFREQFLDDYYAECEEHLVLIRRHLLAIETQIGAGRIDIALLDELFRSFHTIKGISGMVGLSAVEQVAHSIEGMLRSLRQAELTFSVERLDGMIAAITLIETVIAARRGNEPIPSITGTVEQLQKLSLTNVAESHGDAPSVSSVSDQRPASIHRWTVEFTPTAALSEKGININTVRDRLKQVGEILKSIPQVKGQGEISFQFVVETETDLVALGLGDHGVVVKASDATAREVVRPALSAAPTNLVRVDLARLDELMRMIGEMVTSRARIEDQVKQSKRSLAPAEWRQLWETTQTMSRQLRDLREGVMRVRMVQIGEVFERMQFVVRDLARESGKRIVLEVLGRETEIDKYLVEKMMDPLLHLVRNAVSHGLERPDERESHGKPAEGRLTLRATTSGESVLIDIVDDGRGIDVEAVIEKAKDKGLLDSSPSLDNAALLDLICLAGFSTRLEADRESGRGVGMDVVKKTVEALSGTISLSTAHNRGTTFHIELPLTLAIADALIVTACGETYAVPQTAVREILEVEPSSVRELERNEIVAYREGVLPLLRLEKVFNLSRPAGSSDTAFHVFVTGTGASALGIAVDRVIGHREIVVRGIADHLAQVPGIAGATDLGDERVVLILDVPALRRATFDGRALKGGAAGVAS